MKNKYTIIKKMLTPLILTILFFGAVSTTISQAPQNGAIPKILKVLVIEQDPYLKTKDNIRASVYLNQDKDIVVDELVEDLKYSSHGNIEVKIVKKEHLDEFPTFTVPILLKNGKSSNLLDEETWLEIMKNGWWGFWDSPYYKIIPPLSYDYDYLINKCDLINRKNNGEFDEVWFVNVDPINGEESKMIGSTAYWINGSPIIMNAINFKLMELAIARPDVNFECFGHAAEDILQNVFGSRYNSYQKNDYEVQNIDDLNLWERFTLNNFATPDFSSVGNIHFAPNSIEDYDWENKTIVQSSWIDWLDYPNLTGKTKASNSEDWVPFTDNQFSAARQHHRWWFALMPHICEGRTKDGYSNNWWDYLFNGDYVIQITNNSSKTEYEINEYISLNFNLEYLTGQIESKIIDTVGLNDLNIHIENDKIVALEQGKLRAISEGSTIIRVYYDNQYADFTINVSSQNNCIEKTSTLDSLQFFPNPAADYIEIKLNRCATLQKCGTSQVDKIKIYNSFGECVINFKFQITNFEDNVKVDISHLPVGIYFIQIGNHTEKFTVIR